MVLDFCVSLIYNPIGLYACFKTDLQIGYLALAMYAVFASYFAGTAKR